jgi:PleD family two-component response regulator
MPPIREDGSNGFPALEEEMSVKVVVFDDDAQVRQLYEAILEEGNYESATYPVDPDIVNDIVRNDAPSLFIVSPVTGEDRGWQLLEVLHNNEKTKQVPVMAGRILREVPRPDNVQVNGLVWLPREMDVEAVLAKIAEVTGEKPAPGPVE